MGNTDPTSKPKRCHNQRIAPSSIYIEDQLNAAHEEAADAYHTGRLPNHVRLTNLTSSHDPRNVSPWGTPCCMMMKKKKEGGNISWHLSPTLSQFSTHPPRLLRRG